MPNQLSMLPSQSLFLQAYSPCAGWLRLAACHPSFRVIRGADVFIVSAPAALACGGFSFPILEVRLNHSSSRCTQIPASGFPLFKRHPLGQSGSSLYGSEISLVFVGAGDLSATKKMLDLVSPFCLSSVLDPSSISFLSALAEAHSSSTLCVPPKQLLVMLILWSHVMLKVGYSIPETPLKVVAVTPQPKAWF